MSGKKRKLKENVTGWDYGFRCLHTRNMGFSLLCSNMCNFIPTLYKEKSSKHPAVMPTPHHITITVTLKETFNILHMKLSGD
jgi:hypothetical protein